MKEGQMNDGVSHLDEICNKLADMYVQESRQSGKRKGNQICISHLACTHGLNAGGDLMRMGI